MITRILESEWDQWRRLRLRALSTDPDAFSSSHERESGYPAEEWQERTRTLASSPNRALLVVRTDGGFVGSLILSREDDDPSCGHLGAMWVAPEARAQGWGRRLLTAAAQHARNAGMTRLYLLVMPDNNAARSLYHDAGFVESTCDPRSRGAGTEGCIAMEKALGRTGGAGAPSGS